jgi:hypothetical protein
VLWAVSLQIIFFPIDRYSSNYQVEGNCITFRGFSEVPLAQEHAQDVSKMRFWTATGPIWCALLDLACGCPKLCSKDILGVLLCKGNSTEASKSYTIPFLLDNWKNICLGRILLKAYTTQPEYSGHFREHLPGL